jgi:AraC-like DNA-binding protein
MFETFEPENIFLKQWIDYIFHYSSGDPGFERQLIIFPNTGAAVTFYFNVEFRGLSSQKFVSKEKKGHNGVVLHINRVEPIEIIERGRQERITVVFKTLGINHFIAASLDEVCRNQNPTAINISAGDKRYHDLLQRLNSLSSIGDRVSAIEDFFVSVYKNFEDPLLEKIIAHFNSFQKLTTIATNAATTTKTIDRLFKKHIGLTPVEFRRILKFRISLRSKLSGKNSSLQNLAFETDYSDLPYMMKVYRKFTGQTAKTFFDRLSVSANGKYLYQEIL